MVGVLNLIVTVIVTMSILKIESYAQDTTCESHDNCIGHEICEENECINGCVQHTCTGDNEECLTRDHIAKCVCKIGFVRKADGQCGSPICTNSSECDVLERCRSAENEYSKKCQCDIGFKENPYSNPRCVDDESIPSCGYNEDCENGYICYRGKCITICSTTKCPENEECIESYGRCDCKDGYRRDSKGQCKRYCTNNSECKKRTEACVVIDGITQCGCPDGFIRNTYPPFICRQPCETKHDCPQNQACSDSRCVVVYRYHPRND